MNKCYALKRYRDYNNDCQSEEPFDIGDVVKVREKRQCFLLKYILYILQHSLTQQVYKFLHV